MFNFSIIVLEQTFIYVPLLLGAYISFSLLKVPDLSIESAYLFGGLFVSLIFPYIQGHSLAFIICAAVIISILGGALIGITSSCITFFGKVPHLLSSIITAGLYHGIFQLLSNSYVSLAPYKNSLMLLPYMNRHPEFLILAALSIFISIACFFLLHTQLGYSFAIFGNNPLFFKHFKISTGYVFIMGILFANGLAGLSGYLFAQTNNLVEINMGIGKSLFCITALILGKIYLSQKQVLSIFIPLGGAFTYFFLQQLLLKVGFNLKYFTAIQALLVLLMFLILYKRSAIKMDQLGV